MAIEQENIFINIFENLKSRLESEIGTEIMSKEITYIFGSQAFDETDLPAIAIEDVSTPAKTTAELGGRHNFEAVYNVWIHAGGTGDKKQDEGMKQLLKGKMLNIFSKKYSLPFYDYINNEESGYYYQTDISLRNSTPFYNSKLDSHKCLGLLIIKLIY